MGRDIVEDVLDSVEDLVRQSHKDMIFLQYKANIPLRDFKKMPLFYRQYLIETFNEIREKEKEKQEN